MGKCGNEEIKILQGLQCSRHVLSPSTVSDFINLLVGCHSDDQFHISPFDPESRARLGTNSFGRVKGPKSRSLD